MGCLEVTRPPSQSKGACGRAVLAALLAVFGVTGCATGPSAGARYVSTGDPVADGLTMVEQGPPRDRVLWQYRTALEALRRGDDGTAKSLLDQAIARLQGIYGPDAEARKSRRLFEAEAKKTFLGEPYERVMAYFYPRLLYLRDGEPDNARACFLSGQFMDSDAEGQEYAGDYALLDYLEGLATMRMGGDGSEALARSRDAARLQQPPDYTPTHRVLLFAESGRGPLKYATGEYREELRFREGHSAPRAVRVCADDRSFRLEPWDDLTFQATTRGGRLMDHVLANKAVFKRATDSAGNAAIIGGAIMATQRNQNSAVDEVGAGLMVAGVLSKIISAATTPQADTRTWDNLPNYLYFGTLDLAPGRHQITADFLSAQNQPIPGTNITLEIEVVEGRDTVVFLSDQHP